MRVRDVFQFKLCTQLLASKVAATTTIDDEFASFGWSNECFSLEQIAPLTFRSNNGSSD
jgi:hypothetical protein